MYWAQPMLTELPHLTVIVGRYLTLGQGRFRSLKRKVAQ